MELTDDQDLERIESIFHDALQRSPEMRTGFVTERCAGDVGMREEVLQLLASLDTAAEFLETDPHVGAAEDDHAPEGMGGVVPGTEVGPFTLGRLLGHGGAGAVYEAEQDHPRRRVALKLVRGGLASPSAQRRFEYEATILAQLHHPNIAQIYEAGRFDTGAGAMPWFAMELVEDAKDLATYADARQLDLPARIHLFQQVCDAVDYGHRRGVVHRDLKPANILVDASGRPRVIDFGVARVTDADLMRTTLETRVGQLIGTAQYMSPEQWQADPSKIDGRTDVYALGTVLFELLAGRPPHDLSSTSLAEAQRIVLQTAPPRPSAIRDALPRDLDNIVLKALAKDPSRRYGSPGDLARDLGRFLAHEPIEARPPSRLYHLALFARRNRGAVISLALVVATLVLATGVSTGFAVEANRATAYAADRATEAGRLFEKGRHLTRWIVEDFFAEIRNIPGGTRARHVLTSRVLEYLDGLLKPDSDPGLCREVAGHFALLAQLQGDPEFDNVGDPRAALRSFEQASAIYAGLESRGVDVPEDRLERGRILRSVAAIQFEIGEVEAGEASLNRARAQLETVASESDPTSRLGRTARSRIAVVDLDRAWRRIVGGKFDGLRRELEGILRRQEALAADGNRAGETGWTLIAAHGHLAELGVREGRQDDAARHCALVLELCSQAMRASPGLREQQRLAQACVSSGDVLIHSGQPESALPHYARALEIREDLATRDPGSVHAKRKLALSHQRMGDILVQLNRGADALAHYQEDHAFALAFARQHPDHRVAQRAVWISADKLATCHYQLRDFASAARFTEVGLETVGDLAAAEDAEGIDLQGFAQALTMRGTLRVVGIGPEDDAEAAKREAAISLRAAETVWERVAARGQLSESQRRLRAANQSVLKLVDSK